MKPDGMRRGDMAEVDQIEAFSKRDPVVDRGLAVATGLLALLVLALAVGLFALAMWVL